MKRLHSLLILLTLSFTAGAQACPEAVAQMKTEHLQNESLCTLWDRYHRALTRLKWQGVLAPERMADLIGPRMINTPTWELKKAKGVFDPRFVYDPAPKTWDQWDVSAAKVDAEALTNLRQKSIAPISFEWLNSLNDIALKGLIGTAGQFRKGLEIGQFFWHSTSVRWNEAQAMQNSEYRTLKDPTKHLMIWHPTQCLEDRTAEFREGFAKQYQKTRTIMLGDWKDDPQAFFMENGEKRQCGYVVYARPEEVLPQMRAWLQFTNDSTQAWMKHPGTRDILVDAAKIQRWFITIHPFEKGNGRLSRLSLDYVLRSLGFPSPLLANMDMDLYNSETDWADQIGLGLQRATRVAEACARNPSKPECKVVPSPLDPQQNSTFYQFPEYVF